MELIIGLLMGASIIVCTAEWRYSHLLETISEEELTRLLVKKKKRRLIAEQAEKIAADEVQSI